MAVWNFYILIYFFTRALTNAEGEYNMSGSVYCPYFRNGPNLDVRDLVGVWMTVYTQPKAVNCFTLNIRATTDLEREQYTTQYGNFSGRVNWAYCFLEVDSPFGKHYLQGDGSSAGLLENIVITFDDKGRHNLQDQSGDQWTMFGRRGSELLLMRDCSGETVAVFARAPYWPSTTDLYAILHRSGITQLTRQRVLCEPLDLPTRHCFTNNYYTTKKVEIP